MSKVDVLGVLKDRASYLRDEGYDFTADQLLECRAVLAELIEAAKEVEKDAEILGMSCSRLNAALTNLGSTK